MDRLLQKDLEEQGYRFTRSGNIVRVTVPAARGRFRFVTCTAYPVMVPVPNTEGVLMEAYAITILTVGEIILTNGS